jgi:HD-GYP domain-containing protein (c-di-GMP phosphodiesterase class II)
MRHTDEHDDPTMGSRLAFSRTLHENRSMLADAVGERLTHEAGRGTALIVRTLITAMAKALETADPQLIVHWAHMARGAHCRGDVSEAIVAVCNAATELSRQQDDAGMLLCLIEIIKVKAQEALTLRSGDPVAKEDRATIEAVLAMLRARDEATCVHSRATGMWCRRLAETLGLSGSMTDRIVLAGVLHDVGKIATPDEILLKTGPLDAEEWAIMRQHAVFGADILADIPSLAQYAPIVRSHHERFDGTGYPDGLAGEAILFEARVIAVADAFHAMISDRPYRAALSFGTALAVLREGSGTQWDSEVVAAMVTTAATARNRSADASIAPPAATDEIAASAIPLTG